ncbi:MAG: CARDB domain-containing protein [Promethearchaeia archaeon]
MRLERKIITISFIVAFLVIPSVVTAASTSPAFAPAQNPEEIIGELLDEGAEILLSSIDEEGAPRVLYGQLGLPSDALAIEDEMYDDCMALALVATQGEFLNYVFDLVGVSEMTGGGFAEDGFTPSQFDGGMDMSGIMDYLGDEFTLMFAAYLNIDESTAQSRMDSVRSHLHSADGFGFNFAELLTLRIDEDTIPEEEENVTLPFDSIDLFLYEVSNPFDDAVSAVLGGLSHDGLLGSIDETVFTDARGSAAGMLAIPDIANLVQLFEGSSQPATLPDFAIAQNPFENVTGPIAIAAAGYVGEQHLALGDTELKLSSLVGSPTEFNPLPDGLSVVMADMPVTSNITGYSPNVANMSFYDNSSKTVFWNATGIGTVSDYILNFESDSFPPNVTISRSFSPEAVAVGGATTVTVTVTNNGDSPITNITVSDTGLSTIYDSVTVDGNTQTTVSSVSPGESMTMQYTVTFPNEGSYSFPGAAVMYEYDGKLYDKNTDRQSVIVRSELGSLFMQGLQDGWPYAPLALGLVGLGAVFNLVRLVRGRGGTETYEV